MNQHYNYKDEMRPIVCKFCGKEGELVKIKIDGVTNYQGECINPYCVLYQFNSEPMPIKAQARYKWEEFMGRADKKEMELCNA